MCCFTLLTNKIFLNHYKNKMVFVRLSMSHAKTTGPIYLNTLQTYMTNSVASNSFCWLYLFHCFKMVSAYVVITKKTFKFCHFYNLIFVTMAVELGRLFEMFSFLFIIFIPLFFEQNRVGQLEQ